MGVDVSILYLRKTVDLQDDVKPYASSVSRYASSTQGVIGFCGDIYPFIRVTTSKLSKDIDGQPKWNVEIRHFWDADEWRSFLDSKRRFHVFDRENNWPKRIFQEHKVPVFVRWELDKTILNPRLKDFGFASVVNPYDAFQRIAGYISGVLGASMEAPDITDDDVIRDKKGFDERSFRQEKGMHRKDRRRKRRLDTKTRE
jgi:hypothetical protein